jgi:hypothetical protein
MPGLQTTAVHAATASGRVAGACVQPIFQAATFAYEGEANYNAVRSQQTLWRPRQGLGQQRLRLCPRFSWTHALVKAPAAACAPAGFCMRQRAQAA